MQLELFDIRSHDAAENGKTNRLADGTVNAAAAVKANTAKSTPGDFSLSLAMVSEENQDKSADNPTAITDPDQTPDSDDLILLGDILEDVIRAWPTGKKQVFLAGTGDEMPDFEKPGSGSEKPGIETETPSAKGLMLSEAGKGGQAKARVWQGVTGFTAALVKRLHNAPKLDGAQQGVESILKAATGAGSLKTGSAARLEMQGSTGGKGTGNIVSAADETPTLKRPVPAKNAGTSSDKADCFGRGKVFGEENRQPAGAVKRTPKAAGPQAPILKSTGKNVEAGVKNRPVAVNVETKMTRPAAAEQGRFVGGRLPENRAIDPRPSNSRPETGGISTSLAKNPQDGVTGSEPKTIRTVPVRGPAAAIVKVDGEISGDRNPGTTQGAGKPAASGPQVFFPARGPVKGRKLDQKSARLRNAADHPVSERLRHPTTAGGEKSAAAAGGRVSPGEAVTVADKKNSGAETPVGQTVKDLTRELKGAEQPRFETAAVKVKPVENVPVPVSGQPGPAGAVPLENEKPYIARELQAKVLKQITAKMRLSARKGGHEIRINLKPETLGQLQLKVLSQDHTVIVKMVADTHAAKEIIENNLGQLRADLNTLGLNVDKLSVDVFTASDPSEREPAEHRGSYSRSGTDTGKDVEEDGEPGDQSRQMQAAEDAVDGGTLIGVFA